MNTNTHIEIKTLTEAETEYFKELQNRTIEEICDEYGYKSHQDIAIEEIVFDDNVTMDICLTFEHQYDGTMSTYLYAALYGKNHRDLGMTAGIPFSYDNFLREWTITTEKDRYTFIIKESDDCENDNLPDTKNQKPAEDKNETTNQTMNFGDALAALKNGKQVFRTGWNGKGMYLKLQQPDENSKMTLPYIYMRTAQGDFVPWLASQTDMLAEDWLEAKCGELTVKQLWEKYLEYLHNWANNHVDPASSDKTPMGFDEWYNKWSYNYDV